MSMDELPDRRQNPIRHVATCQGGRQQPRPEAGQQRHHHHRRVERDVRGQGAEPRLQRQPETKSRRHRPDRQAVTQHPPERACWGEPTWPPARRFQLFRQVMVATLRNRLIAHQSFPGARDNWGNRGVRALAPGRGQPAAATKLLAGWSRDTWKSSPTLPLEFLTTLPGIWLILACNDKIKKAEKRSRAREAIQWDTDALSAACGRNLITRWLPCPPRPEQHSLFAQYLRGFDAGGATRREPSCTCANRSKNRPRRPQASTDRGD